MRPSIIGRLVLAVVFLPGATAPAQQSAPPLVANQLARDIYKELVEINTTDSVGSTTKAAEAMAERLKAAGFPAADIQVLGPDPRKGNLVARFRGTGARKPLLLLAHTDVVEARREDWSFDPFTFLERDGFFYGRGTSDDKAMAASFVANLIRLKQEGYRPDRDLILALTADEEGGSFNGVDWLLKNHRGLIDAEMALNEGGDGQIRNGKYLTNQIGASEKVYQSFLLEGGHADNALPQTARATVNCRILPGEAPAGVKETLTTVLADPKISVSFLDEAKPSPPSPLPPEVMGALESITRAMWPGVVVVPTMGTGATDGLYLRNAGIPSYGVDGLFGEVDDVRAHGKDERVGVKQYYESIEFHYRLVKALSSRN